MHKYHNGSLYSVILKRLQVEWDEINAAWGQAALLLHTMAQYFTPKFQYPSFSISTNSILSA